MAHDAKPRGGSRATGSSEAAAAATVPVVPTAAPPVPEGATAPPFQPPLEEGDSEGRTKVPLAWIIENGERVLGIPKHELVAAFTEDGREELTLNAVRKTVSDWRLKVQNPDVAEES